MHLYHLTLQKAGAIAHVVYGEAAIAAGPSCGRAVRASLHRALASR